MKKAVQRAFHCPCGREQLLAQGLCATCYTLKRQDLDYFGGNREIVLARDGYRCAVPGCTSLKRGKRSIAVHHRVPGNNDPKRLLSLCLACHAKITRTQVVRRDWPPLLRLLWREQHPNGHEQTRFDFGANTRVPEPVPLFGDLRRTRSALRLNTAHSVVA